MINKINFYELDHLGFPTEEDFLEALDIAKNNNCKVRLLYKLDPDANVDEVLSVRPESELEKFRKIRDEKLEAIEAKNNLRDFVDILLGNKEKEDTDLYRKIEEIKKENIDDQRS
jgi:hypothetical protein